MKEKPVIDKCSRNVKEIIIPQGNKVKILTELRLVL